MPFACSRSRSSGSPGWPRIRSIIIWKTSPRRAKHAHLIPGRGAIDFPAVLREIEKSGYQGWITVELYPYIENPDDAGREAKEFVEEVESLGSTGSH